MAGNKPDKISLAKLSRPHLPKVVERQRLFKELDGARDYPIIWITAPPGMGKTTLAASYLQARKLPCLWYQIDEGDAETATLFHYLGLAIKKYAPRYRQPLLHLTPEYLPGLTTFTRRFFETFFGRMKAPAVLVLDNYQQLPLESSVHDLLEIGLSMLPSGCTAIIMSREHPPPAMARLQADQSLRLITPEALKLTPPETKQIIQLHKPTLSTKKSALSVAKSQEMTRGWVGGLILLLQDVSVEAPTGLEESECVPEMLFNYLAREVLKRLPSETQTLLLTSSIFPFFTSGMARSLSGVVTAKEELNRFYQSRYFIERRPGVEQTYQYHPLFQSFLQAKLHEQSSTKEILAIKRRAGHILKKAGWEEEAVILLLAVEEFEALTTIILSQAALMLAQGRGKTLEHWIRSLPQNVIDQHPWVAFWLGNCLIGSSEEEAQHIFKKTFERFQKNGDTEGALFAWCGYVEATMFRWEDMSVLDPWFEQFPLKDWTQLNEFDPALQARVSASMFMLFHWRRPNDPAIHTWYELAVARMTMFADPFQSIRSAFNLITFNFHLGRMEAARDVVRQLEALTKNCQLPELAQFHLNSVLQLCAFYSGDLERCRDIQKKNKAIGKSGGFFQGTHEDA